MNRIKILGSSIDDVVMSEVLEFIDESIAADDFKQIITLNAEIAYNAHFDSKMQELINSVAMVTPDGSGILWAADKLGTPLRERVSGIDILQQMLIASNAKGYRIYLLGASEEVNSAAYDRIIEQFPSIKLAGRRNGFFKEENVSSILEDIRSSKADILVVAMGAPRQDFWLRDFGSKTGAKIGIGVGGSLDVISGKVKRAPIFYQKMKLEWLYRLLKEPWRYKRMMVLPKFVLLIKKIAKIK